MKPLSTYFKNWIYYCYYRSVKMYSKPGKEPEYFDGIIPFYFWGALIEGVILFNMGDDFLASFKKHILLVNIPIGIIMIIVLRLFLNAEKYKRMDALFGSESKQCNIIMGILVFLTFVLPIVALFSYGAWMFS